MRAPRSRLPSTALILCLPLLVHFPALIGWLHFAPIYIAADVTQPSWTGAGGSGVAADRPSGVRATEHVWELDRLSAQ